MNPIQEYFKVVDSLPWTRSIDGAWTSLSTDVWKMWNYGACEKLRNAQHYVQRIAFGAFVAGVFVGGIVMLAVVFFYFGVR